MSGITIVGLGPGHGGLLTRQAWQIISEASTVYLRTARHPAVGDLPDSVPYVSFDALYEQADSFEQVYEQIAEEVLRLSRQPGGVIYAVPGDPHVGESTVSHVVAAARVAGIQITIAPGISFVEPTLNALSVDGMTGLQLYDAIELASNLYPPVNPDFPLLIGQVYSRLVAGDLKLGLMAVYPAEHGVMLVHNAGMAAELVERIPLYELDRSQHIDHLSSLYVPPRQLPADLSALAEAVAVLRSPDGCPWDQEQTSQSLRVGFLEEVSEALTAIDEQDPIGLQEELGDVLLHIVMQAQIAREDELFGLADVIAGIHAKIKRRHPHVWGDWQASDAQEVITHWEQLKAEEKGPAGSESLVDNIPVSLPALARSQKIQNRVKKIGFDWPTIEGVLAKVLEEIAELKAADGPVAEQQELGDILFAVVNWARWLNIDAESALREANLRFLGRFRMMEELAAEKGLELAMLETEALEMLWQTAKQLSRQTDHRKGLS